MKRLIIGDPSGHHTLHYIERGEDPSDIYVWEDSTKGRYYVTMRGATVTDDLSTFGGMKFDIVIGNPPFQSGQRTSSYNQLWAEFFLQGFDLLTDDGEMSLIHPVTWAAPKDGNRQSITNRVRSILREHATYINYLECGRHFGSVGSTFCTTTVTKRPNRGECRVVTETDTFYVNHPSEFVDYVLSKNNNQTSLAVMRKIKAARMLTPLSTKKALVGDLVEEKDDKHVHRVQYAATTVRWSNTEHPLQNFKKILFPNQSTRNFPIYDAGVSAPCNRGAVYLVDSDAEGNNCVTTLRTKVMEFFYSHQRFHHGLLNTAVVNSIPALDYSRAWTNEELATEFGLTDDELDYVLKS